MSLAFGVLALTLVVPATSAAQAKFEVTPFFTSYFEIASYLDSTDAATSTTFKEKHSNAPGVGGRVTVWLNRQLGFQGEFTYVGTGRQEAISSPTGTGGFFISGNALLASGRVVYRPRRSNLYLLGGLGWVKRGGDAWDESLFAAGTKFRKSNIAGVVGVGVRASVTPSIGLDVLLESYLYSVDRDDNDNVTVQDVYTSKFTPDILLSIGVPIGKR